MSKTQEQIAREWALGFFSDAATTTYQQTQAAVEFILEATKPQTMGDAK